MQTLVIGATGVVGGHIVDQLLLGGEEPFALSRFPPAVETRRVHWIKGDLTDPSTLHALNISTIYCTAHSAALAAGLPYLVGSGLQRLVLFTSSSLVTKADSDIEYEREGLRRLAAGEAATIAFCQEHDISWTVLRPTMIYDEGRDVNISRLARLIARFGMLALAGRGNGLRQPVHAQDLAIGAIKAASSDVACDKIYALPGADTITYREMVGRIFDGLGKPRMVVPLPASLWRFGFFLTQRWLPNANASMGTRMSKDMIFDPTPAQKDFGWSPRGFRPRFNRSEAVV